jgi:hypothetical protein
MDSIYQRLPIAIASAALGFAAIAATPQSSHAVTLTPPVIDQEFPVLGGLGAVLNGGFTYVGQTYTAGLTGTLIGVNVAVYSFENVSAPPLQVAIHEVIGGVPTSTVLGQTLFEPSTSYITSFSEFLKFPTAIPQVSGEQYSIVVNYLDAPPLGEFLGQWIGSPNNDYLEGQNFFSNDLTNWKLSIGDLAFRTFVLPQELSCR